MIVALALHPLLTTTPGEGAMRMGSVVVPLDGSITAEGALSRATEIARSTGARLVLVRAAQAHSFPGADPISAQLAAVREAEAYLADVANRLRTLGIQAIKCSVWYGSAAAAIAEAAQFNRADLIVMTTHGRSGLGRLLMGSVTEAVLRGTSVPVLVVRDAGTPRETPAGDVPVASHA
jgi:nucleotide-binding universal stress UspA family protein